MTLFLESTMALNFQRTSWDSNLRSIIIDMVSEKSKLRKQTTYSTVDSAESETIVCWLQVQAGMLVHGCSSPKGNDLPLAFQPQQAMQVPGQ